jgi:ankyrin repeat protein
LAILILIVEKGADVGANNHFGLTALHGAAACGYEAVVGLLLQKNAEVEIKDKAGRTALSLAIECGHEAVVHLLLESSTQLRKPPGVSFVLDGETQLEY